MLLQNKHILYSLLLLPLTWIRLLNSSFSLYFLRYYLFYTHYTHLPGGFASKTSWCEGYFCLLYILDNNIYFSFENVGADGLEDAPVFYLDEVKLLQTDKMNLFIDEAGIGTCYQKFTLPNTKVYGKDKIFRRA